MRNEDMPTVPDTHIYNNLIDGSAKATNHMLADRILQYMTLQGVPKDQWTYAAAIKVSTCIMIISSHFISSR